LAGLPHTGQDRVVTRLEVREPVQGFQAKQLIEDPVRHDRRHRAGGGVDHHGHADAVVGQQHALGQEPVDAAAVFEEPVTAVPADEPAQAVGVPGGGGEGPVLRQHDVRFVLARHRAR
jgi:hypothetical protein